MEEYITGTGQKIFVHNKEDCSGHCAIHNPSDHHMKDLPTHWRDDRKLMERIDPFGIGHPDPDDLAYKKSLGIDITYESIHGCNGFCNPKIANKLLKKLKQKNLKNVNQKKQNKKIKSITPKLKT